MGRISEVNSVRGTVFGVVAMLIWATSVAVSRNLSEQIGVFSAAGYSYFTGGAIGMIVIMTKRSMRVKFCALPLKYYMSCGLLMLTYNIVVYLAVGLSLSRHQVLGVTLINYLWPSFILIFTISILHRKTRPWVFLGGIALVLIGAYMATIHNRSLSWVAFVEEIKTAPVPYLFALVGAVSWGLYTVLNTCWSERMEFYDGYLLVPLVFLVSGASLLVVRGYFEGNPVWTYRAFLEILYQAVFVWLIAYVLWTIAAQKANIVWLGILSLFMPVFSTLFSCIYLRVVPAVTLWFACGILVLGAWICKHAVLEQQPRT